MGIVSPSVNGPRKQLAVPGTEKIPGQPIGGTEACSWLETQRAGQGQWQWQSNTDWTHDVPRWGWGRAAATSPHSACALPTGHLIGPVLCHSFCNYVGFPAVGAALEHPQRVLVVFFYLLGMVLFLLLLHPMTDPAFFGHLPICSLARLPSPDTSSSFSWCS